MVSFIRFAISHHHTAVVLFDYINEVKFKADLIIIDHNIYRLLNWRVFVIFEFQSFFMSELKVSLSMHPNLLESWILSHRKMSSIFIIYNLVLVIYVTAVSTFLEV